MKVSELISELQSRNPDAELIFIGPVEITLDTEVSNDTKVLDARYTVATLTSNHPTQVKIWLK